MNLEHKQLTEREVSPISCSRINLHSSEHQRPPSFISSPANE